MNILLFGSSGFIGSEVQKVLSEKYDVYATSKDAYEGPRSKVVDLLDPVSIEAAMDWAKPEVVINCAGVVENSDNAHKNVLFTQAIIKALGAGLSHGLPVKTFIVCGSAAEYGNVADATKPIAETAPRAATSKYGISKKEETEAAEEFGKVSNINVVIARIFNPIGLGMHERFLVPSLLKQLQSIKHGQLSAVTISRKDAARDYTHVKDIARAIGMLVEKANHSDAYNIGTGKATTNERLVQLLASYSGFTATPEIVETASEPEQPVASIADITKIQREFGWQPIYTIENTVEEIVYAK